MKETKVFVMNLEAWKKILKMIKIFVMNIQVWKKNTENDQTTWWTYKHERNTENDSDLHDEPTRMKETLKIIKIFLVNLQAFIKIRN